MNLDLIFTSIYQSFYSILVFPLYQLQTNTIIIGSIIFLILLYKLFVSSFLPR